MKRIVICAFLATIIPGYGPAFSERNGDGEQSALCKLGSTLQVMSEKGAPMSVNFVYQNGRDQDLPSILTALAYSSDNLELKSIKKIGKNEKYQVIVSCSKNAKKYRYVCLKTATDQPNSNQILCGSFQNV